MSKDVESTLNHLRESLSLADYLAKEADLKQTNGSSATSEKNVLLVGEKCSGRTSLLNILLSRKGEKLCPTITPSFDFATKDDAIANIWEMGQIVHHGIAAVPLNMDRPKDKVIVMIVLDLSKPENVIVSLTEWFAFLRRASTLGKNNNTYKGDINSKSIVDDLPFEVLIVGNKYDKFKNIESAKRKFVCSALRYFAHVSNSYLVFASTKDKTARDNFKKVGRELVFSKEEFYKGIKLKQNVDDSTGPLVVFAARMYGQNKKAQYFDSMKEISESIPGNLLTLTKTSRHVMLSTHVTNEVIVEWVSLSASILGKESFELDHTNTAREIRKKLSSFPNEKIDAIRAEAEEEIMSIRRKQAIDFGFVQVDNN